MSGIDAENWQRVSRHLDRILELPESQWADYLAALDRKSVV